MPFSLEVSIDNEEWYEVPEQIFYDSLYRHVSRVTPLIKEMLASKVVQYGNARYRIICVKGDDKNEK